MDSPEVQEQLEAAGLDIPSGPALLSNDGTHVQLKTGLGMRLELARVLGPRRANHIFRLTAIETEARVDRHANEGQLSRRGAIGAAVAGAFGLVFGSQTAAAAASRGSSQDTGGFVPLDQQQTAELARQARNDPAVQKLASKFGKRGYAYATEDVFAFDTPGGQVVHLAYEKDGESDRAGMIAYSTSYNGAPLAESAFVGVDTDAGS